MDEIPCEKWSGFLIENKNQLEIWYNRKKIYKTNTADMVNQLLLFPIININTDQKEILTKKGIYIINKEIGNLGVYERIVNNEPFKIEDIGIETVYFQNAKIISNINYKNQPLNFVKKDTIITQQFSLEVE